MSNSNGVYLFHLHIKVAKEIRANLSYLNIVLCNLLKLKIL